MADSREIIQSKNQGNQRIKQGLEVKQTKDMSQKDIKVENNTVPPPTQHWGGNSQLSMGGIDVEYFPNSVDLDRNETKSEFNSYISDKN